MSEEFKEIIAKYKEYDKLYTRLGWIIFWLFMLFMQSCSIISKLEEISKKLTP